MIFAVLVMAMFMLAGCGADNNTTPNSTASQIPKGSVKINTQLYLTGNYKTTAKTVALASAEELALRKLIDHVDFNFITTASKSLQTQTLTVNNGLLSGTLNVDPGQYTLGAIFYTKTGIQIFNAYTQVEITSNNSTDANLVIQQIPITSIPAAISNPIGRYIIGHTYQVNLYGADNSYSGGDWNAHVNESGQLFFTASFMTTPLINNVRVTVSDEDGQIHEATFIFDLQKAINDCNTSNYTVLTWPNPGAVNINSIFASDDTGYVKTTFSHATSNQFCFNLNNLTGKDVTVSEINIMAWDVRYMQDFMLTRDEIGIKASDPIPRATLINDGEGTIRYTTNTTIGAGLTMRFCSNFTSSADYPSNEMRNHTVTNAVITDNDGKRVPFLQDAPMAW